ncbi:MAG TPA: 4Fe-4S dicluster domain-containing protein [bacterium]|nr:4Fe-4S dicluster domain-containing protein [bacterium]
MATRTVIEIDEQKCDGCGICTTGCHEGALRIIDGKARLVGESLCDGLGACIGECPRGALTTVERDVEAYDERRVIEHILPKGMATLAAHLEHLASHGQDSWHAQAVKVLNEKNIAIPVSPVRKLGVFQPLRAESSAPHGIDNGMSGGCTASAAMAFGPSTSAPGSSSPGAMTTRLEQWPVQLHLINPRAPYFNGADLLIAADCTAYACGAFHQVLMAGRRLIIACPKLDSGKEVYIDKIRALVREAGVASITIAIMNVACCSGLKRLVNEALSNIEHNVPIATVVINAKDGAMTWL